VADGLPADLDVVLAEGAALSEQATRTAAARAASGTHHRTAISPR
jgi:hypothetical protein